MKSALFEDDRDGPRMSLGAPTLADILEHARPLGHHEEPDTLNIGFGFDVHFNSASLDAEVGFVRHYPALSENAYMATMHWRTLLGLEPYYTDSTHIVQNERTVTSFAGDYRGTRLTAYVGRIGARTVHGIDSYVAPGERVRAGETILIR